MKLGVKYLFLKILYLLEKSYSRINVIEYKSIEEKIFK